MSLEKFNIIGSNTPDKGFGSFAEQRYDIVKTTGLYEPVPESSPNKEYEPDNPTDNDNILNAPTDANPFNP